MVSRSLRMNASASSPELPATPGEFKRRAKSLTNLEDPTPVAKKYIHVHHFKNTKLFGAWFNDPSKPGKKMRLFFGSHLTAYLAARAQDRAALKYKPHALDPRSIKLNFKEEDYVEDQILRDMLTCEEFGELLRKESRPKYTKMEPTPCLRKFMARERARGNIPSVVPPQENIISLRQYLEDVIRKREQRDEDMEDPVSTDEESSEDSESSDEEMEDPVPTAEHALKVERQKRSEGKRIVVTTGPRTPCSPVAGPSKRIVVTTGPRTPRSPVAGPSKRKPLVTAPAPLVWGQTRSRSKRYEDHEYNKSPEPAPPIEPEGLPTEVDNTKSPEPGNEGLPLNPQSPEFPELQTKSREPEPAPPTIPGGLPTEVDNTKSSEPGNEGLSLNPQSPEFPELLTKSREPSPPIIPEGLPTEVDNTKSPESGHEGLPHNPQSPELQFTSKWHNKLHKAQQILQTSWTSEPSPNAEGSHLQALDGTRASAEILPAVVENTKTPESVPHIPQSPEFPELQTKSCEPAPPMIPDGLPTEVDNTKTPESGTEGLPHSPQSPEFPELQTKSRELAPPIIPDGLPTEVDNTKSLQPGNEDLPHHPQSPEFPHLQFRSKWHYKQHRIQQSRTSRTSEPSPKNAEDSHPEAQATTTASAEILPAEVENTKTPESRTEGLPQTPEFPYSQFRSKWHYKQHKIQQVQTPRTSEPSPENAEDLHLQALAITVPSQAGELV